MSDDTFTMSFIVVDDLFERYTILINKYSDLTSVYCRECDVWVGQWYGQELAYHTEDEILEEIVDKHNEQVCGKRVEISDGTENFL